MPSGSKGKNVRLPRARPPREDNRPPIDLDPDEEAGVLKGIQEIEEGKGMPISRLRAKLRRYFQ